MKDGRQWVRREGGREEEKVKTRKRRLKRKKEEKKKIWNKIWPGGKEARKGKGKRKMVG